MNCVAEWCKSARLFVTSTMDMLLYHSNVASGHSDAAFIADTLICFCFHFLRSWTCFLMSCHAFILCNSVYSRACDNVD